MTANVHRSFGVSRVKEFIDSVSDTSMNVNIYLAISHKDTPNTGNVNLIEDSSFESGKGGYAVHWQYYGNISEADVLPSGGVDGGSFWRIIDSASGNGQVIGVSKRPGSVTVTSGANYILSGYARAPMNDLAVGKSIGIAEQGEFTVQSTLLNPTLTSEWQRYAFNVTPISASVHPGFLITPNTAFGIYTVDFDQLQLESGTTLTDWKPYNTYIANTPTDIISTKVDLWRDMFGGKKITANDVCAVVPRRDWGSTEYGTTGRVYSPYRSNDNYYANNFYVMTGDYEVYKCIENNYDGISSVTPNTGTSNTTHSVKLSDGYIWKYMYTIDIADRHKFLTQNWMPVRTLESDDGSSQWLVQSNARSGGIESIVVTNVGTGYYIGNLVENSSFENGNTSWDIYGSDGTFTIETGGAAHGEQYARRLWGSGTGWNGIYQTISYPTWEQYTNYCLSFSARASGVAIGDQPSVAFDLDSSSMAPVNIEWPLLTSEWQDYSCKFSTTTDTTFRIAIFYPNTHTGTAGIDFDAVQVVGGDSPIDFDTSTNTNVTITITGSGNGAVALAQLNTSTRQIANVIMLNPGSGYYYANATVSKPPALVNGISGTTATLYPVISPFGGHGSNPLDELGAQYVMINTQLNNGENNKISVQNTLKQVSLIKNPMIYGTSNVLSNTVFSQVTKLTLSSGGTDYTLNEYVYQGVSLSGSTFAGTVLDWDTGNNVISLIKASGTPTSATLTGHISGSARFVVGTQSSDVVPYSGSVIHIDNLWNTIQRANNKSEQFQYIFDFGVSP